ncbi:MAG TPA: Si-specific NAD(P)(+) transhydrogenase [Candidatus Polarisedimenticolia bacterium]|nr:Si-specific NAD(P)(+) transhydrogenase [Candidatus Polarisedimenticolia bacterium]
MITYDLLVIGSGPAGQRAAVQAAKLSKRAAIIEKRQVVGGVCINTGTIPSKTLRDAVLYLTGYGQHAIYGTSYAVKEHITVEDLMTRCSFVVKREIDVIQAQMRRNGVDLLAGEASFVNPTTLSVAGPKETFTCSAERIVIAVGTRPVVPPGMTCDGVHLIDSDGILDMKRLPRTLTVVGAGVIGVEYASIFAALGVEVTVVDKRTRLLDFVDAEIVESLSYQLRQHGTTMRLGEEVARVAVKENLAVAELKSGKKIVSDMILVSAGRMGSTASLNLPAAGLEADERGLIAVDSHYRTRDPHIYAVGDVIGFPSLASTSMEQGRIAAGYALGVPVPDMPTLYPYGIYTIPEISMVGPTEEALTKASIPYETGISRYREIARGQMLGDDTGLLKLLFERETRKLLAAHAIGTGATEMIHIAQAVVTLGGGLDYFLNSVFNYPTLAECYKVAALDCANKLALGA